MAEAGRKERALRTIEQGARATEELPPAMSQRAAFRAEDTIRASVGVVLRWDEPKPAAVLPRTDMRQMLTIGCDSMDRGQEARPKGPLPPPAPGLEP